MSSIALGLVALGLLSGDAPKSPAPAPPSAKSATPACVEKGQTSYEIRMIVLPAIPWRKAVYKDCTRLGRQGVSTVWSVKDATAKEIMKTCQSNEAGTIVAAPKVTAIDGQSASIEIKKARPFVGDVDRVASTEAGRVVGLAFRPIVNELEEGFAVEIEGTPEGESTRINLEIKSRWISSFNMASTLETVEKQSIAAAMQLPQVVDAEVAGCFDLAKDHHLLIGLGTSTIAGPQGQAVTMERLALITPRHVLIEPEEAFIGQNSTKDFALPQEAELHVARTSLEEAPKALSPAITSVPRLMPKPPSRSLPTVADLPPLPDNAVRATSLHTVPAPQASAQAATAAPAPSATEPSASATYAQLIRIDPNVAPARFEPVPVAASTLKRPPAPAPVSKETVQSQTYALPFGGKLTIEVKTSVIK